MNRMETPIIKWKSNLKNNSKKDYPFETFWEARDKAYFTEMQKNAENVVDAVEPCSLL